MVFRRSKESGWTGNEFRNSCLALGSSELVLKRSFPNFRRRGWERENCTFRTLFAWLACSEPHKTLHARLYEAAHKQFEVIHGSACKRQGTTMREGLRIHGFRTSNETLQSKINNENVKPRKTHRKSKAFMRTEIFWLEMDSLVRCKKWRVPGKECMRLELLMTCKTFLEF